MGSYDDELIDASEQPESDPENYGELHPLAGGDPIPLLSSNLLIGRRERCDIVLRFPTVSSHHAQLTLKNGYWFVKDLDSLNFTKVNDTPVTMHYLAPGDILSIAKHKYEIRYSPAKLGATGPPPTDGISDIFKRSLLERAGLERRKPKDEPVPPPLVDDDDEERTIPQDWFPDDET